MTDHKIGSREECAGGPRRAAATREGAHPDGRRARTASAASCRGCRSRRSTGSTPTRARGRWRSSSTVAPSSSSTTSCSGRATRPPARPARRWRTASTALLPHLHARDATMLLVSRAPLEQAPGVQAEDGLEHSLGLLGRERLQLRLRCLVPRRAGARAAGPCAATTRQTGLPQMATATGTDVAGYASEGFGFSAFTLADGAVYHTYSTQGRGVEFLMGYYPILDRAPKGRDDGDSRAPASMLWIRRHDEYEDAGAGTAA